MNVKLPSPIIKAQQVIGDLQTIGETGSEAVTLLSSLIKGTPLKDGTQIGTLFTSLTTLISQKPESFENLKSLPQAIHELRSQITQSKTEAKETHEAQQDQETVVTEDGKEVKSDKKAAPSNPGNEAAKQLDDIIGKLGEIIKQKESPETSKEAEAGEENIDEHTVQNSQSTGSTSIEGEAAGKSSATSYTYIQKTPNNIPEELVVNLQKAILEIGAAQNSDGIANIKTIMKRAEGKSPENNSNIGIKEAQKELEEFVTAVNKNPKSLQKEFNKLNPIVKFLVQYQDQQNTQHLKNQFLGLLTQEQKDLTQALENGDLKNAFLISNGFKDSEIADLQKAIEGAIGDPDKLPQPAKDSNGKGVEEKFQRISKQIRGYKPQYDKLVKEANKEGIAPDLKEKKMQEAQEYLTKQIANIIKKEKLNRSEAKLLMKSLDIVDKSGGKKELLKKAMGIAMIACKQPQFLFMLAVVLKPVAAVASMIPVVGKPIAGFISSIDGIGTWAVSLFEKYLLITKGLGSDNNSKTEKSDSETQAPDANDPMGTIVNMFNDIKGKMTGEETQEPSEAPKETQQKAETKEAEKEAKTKETEQKTEAEVETETSTSDAEKKSTAKELTPAA